jgi:glycosyltransferase involved in cell wall biosynthesis
LKTLLALIEKPGHVCYRYRVQAFKPHLRAAGWDIQAQPLSHGIAPFFQQLSVIAQADAILLQRRLLPWWQIQLLRWKAKTLLFDIDDAVFFRDSNSHRGFESSRRRRRFAAIVRRADAVLAGNAFLAEEARRGSAPRVYELPTCVDASRYAPNPSPRRGGDIRLVWIGSRSTMPALDEIQPGLAEASRRLPGLRLRVICDAFPKLDGVAIEPVVWSEANEAAELASADIGVSFLPEHPWSLGKCGLKVLQYMAAGLPVIANSYGVHRAMIDSGQTGALADSPATWAAAIERLANDPDVRHRYGAAGRSKLDAEFSVAAWGPRLVDILADLERRRP